MLSFGVNTVHGATVGTAPALSLANGSTAILPCEFTGETYGVDWTQQNGHTEPEGDTIIRLDTFFDVDARSGPGFVQGRFNIRDDFSLVISPVGMGDGGRWTCIVYDVASGLPIQNHTDIMVFVYADKPYITIDQCNRNGDDHSQSTSPNECVFNVTTNQTDYHLDCMVSGVKPAVTITWSTTAIVVPDIKDIETVIDDFGTKYRTNSTIRERDDGTYDQSLIIAGNVNATPNGTVFTCAAEGLAVEGVVTRSIVFLKSGTVIPSPDIGGTPWMPNLPVIIPVTIIGILLVMVGGYACWKKRRTQKRSSAAEAKAKDQTEEPLNEESTKPSDLKSD